MLRPGSGMPAHPQPSGKAVALPPSANREPAGGRHGVPFASNSGRIDQVLATADVHGHVLPTYLPSPREHSPGETPPRQWVPKGFASATAVDVGEWRDRTPVPPSRCGPAPAPFPAEKRRGSSCPV